MLPSAVIQTRIFSVTASNVNMSSNSSDSADSVGCLAPRKRRNKEDPFELGPVEKRRSGVDKQKDPSTDVSSHGKTQEDPSMGIIESLEGSIVAIDGLSGVFSDNAVDLSSQNTLSTNVTPQAKDDPLESPSSTSFWRAFDVHESTNIADEGVSRPGRFQEHVEVRNAVSDYNNGLAAHDPPGTQSTASFWRAFDIPENKIAPDEGSYSGEGFQEALQNTSGEVSSSHLIMSNPVAEEDPLEGPSTTFWRAFSPQESIDTIVEDGASVVGPALEAAAAGSANTPDSPLCDLPEGTSDSFLEGLDDLVVDCNASQQENMPPTGWMGPSETDYEADAGSSEASNGEDSRESTPIPEDLLFPIFEEPMNQPAMHIAADGYAGLGQPVSPLPDTDSSGEPPEDWSKKIDEFLAAATNDLP